jgi:ATP-dependent RNA helicase DOB1
MDVEKRKSISFGDVICLGDESQAEPSKKIRRLADDRVAALPVGANLVEFEGKSCTHEVAWPPGSSGSSMPPTAAPGRPSAREYPFKLDPFQQTAINALEAGELAQSSPPFLLFDPVR